MQTNLTSAQISTLSGILTSGRVAARAATKEVAVKRFLAIAEMNGVENAPDLLAMTFEVAKPTVELVKKAIDERDAAITADAQPPAEVAPFAPAPSQPSPGLARLRAARNAEELRRETAAAAAQATALAPLVGNPSARRAALELGRMAEPKPSRAAKAPKTEKVEGESARTKLDTTATIAAVVANPKQPGSRSHARFALYRAGATVQQFIDACVAAGFPAREAKADLSWDRRKQFITIA
ncbi:hypothetical protein [Kaistia sp. MMO-174]|uniref:hypothetical protein n=1 Tax=Kaistia sp. MMO-174 TaxID=3081256 RepID=UPI00301AB90A